MMRKENIPNVITYARVLAIPLFIAAFMMHWELIAVVLFMFASWTDFFDGYLARKWNVETKYGAMLDQISDKLLVCAALLCLVSTGQAGLIPVTIIIFREIMVSGLREFMGNQGIEMPVSKLGKWKTMTQLLSITSLLLAPVAQAAWMIDFGTILLWIAAAISAITATQYSLHAARNI